MTYNSSVIRRFNLQLLIKQTYNGRLYLLQFSKDYGCQSNQASCWAGLRTKKYRAIGDPTARNLEKHFDEKDGCLDIARPQKWLEHQIITPQEYAEIIQMQTPTDGLNLHERKFLALYNALNDHKRHIIDQVIDSYSKDNSND